MKWIFAPILLILSFFIIFISLPLILATSISVFLLGYIPYVILGIAYIFALPYVIVFKRQDLHDNLNQTMGGFMGHDGKTNMSDTSGKIIEKSFNFILCFHCRVLATYDPAGWHCVKDCKSLFSSKEK